MHLLFSCDASHRKAGGVHDINGATTTYEAAMVVENFEDFTNLDIDNSPQGLHPV